MESGALAFLLRQAGVHAAVVQAGQGVRLQRWPDCLEVASQRGLSVTRVLCGFGLRERDNRRGRASCGFAAEFFFYVVGQAEEELPYFGVSTHASGGRVRAPGTLPGLSMGGGVLSNRGAGRPDSATTTGHRGAASRAMLGLRLRSRLRCPCWPLHMPAIAHDGILARIVERTPEAIGHACPIVFDRVGFAHPT